MERLIQLNSEYVLEYVCPYKEINYLDWIEVNLLYNGTKHKLVKGNYSDLIQGFYSTLCDLPIQLSSDLKQNVIKTGLGYYFNLNRKHIWLLDDYTYKIGNDSGEYFLWGLSNEEYDLNVFIYPFDSKFIMEVSNSFDLNGEIEDFNLWIEKDYKVLFKIELTDLDIENIKAQLIELKKICYY